MANSTVEQLLGRACHEIIHLKTHPCSEAGNECAAKHTFETGAIHSSSPCYKDANGEQRYLEIKSYPITNDSGQVTSVIETINDVTEKRKMEERLAKSQKIEAIGQLAGGVAHDFNNMLSVILGHSELALMKINDTHPICYDLNEIRKATDRFISLTKQLLAFARKQTIAPKKLDINETLESMLKMLKRLIGENINLVWLPGQDLWNVKIDPSQIDQILANLCLNARDAISDVGKITIENSNKAIDEVYCADNPEAIQGEYVMLSVSDNGCGMDKNTLNKIFELFLPQRK